MFVEHIFATTEQLPPMPACLYQYVVGANGVFVRAKRPGLEALIWVASSTAEIRGLAKVQPYVKLDQRVPSWTLARLIEMSYRAGGKEILFYLSKTWRIQVPEQVQHGASVHPVNPFAGGPDTLMEIHSHHSMGAFFSTQDDREESAGFRLYGVLGSLGARPQVAVRVGIYGHFWQVPAAWVSDLPAGISDALYQQREELVYEEIEDAY